MSLNLFLLFFSSLFRGKITKALGVNNNFPVVGGKPLQAFRLQALLWRMLACCTDPEASGFV